MHYVQLTVTCSTDLGEMLIAELAEAGFDTFQENTDGFEAFAEDDKADETTAREILRRYGKQASISFTFSTVEKKNWNEEWEKNYEPILVDNRCLIRASFHTPVQTYPYEVIITPKMSFGTGHHQTTYLMVQRQLDMDHTGKRVMDAGCGTAILAIMAAKLGAGSVEAFDIDDWSVINGKENIEVNGTPNVNLQLGKLGELSFTGKFDIILANINKNVLMQELPLYTSYLLPGGELLLSGFYERDIDDLLDAAVLLGLTEVQRTAREGWAALLLKL
ncbi:MAG: 50S ribosomal protein L11 methyltransferase [Bacteroidia bacterium]|nr:50S ribosomal protein L11 methyltransferase [Bacteroidia bacterium]